MEEEQKNPVENKEAKPDSSAANILNRQKTKRKIPFFKIIVIAIIIVGFTSFLYYYKNRTITDIDKNYSSYSIDVTPSVSQDELPWSKNIVKNWKIIESTNSADIKYVNTINKFSFELASDWIPDSLLSNCLMFYSSKYDPENDNYYQIGSSIYVCSKPTEKKEISVNDFRVYNPETDEIREPFNSYSNVKPITIDGIYAIQYDWSYEGAITGTQFIKDANKYSISLVGDSIINKNNNKDIYNKLINSFTFKNVDTTEDKIIYSDKEGKYYVKFPSDYELFINYDFYDGVKHYHGNEINIKTNDVLKADFKMRIYFRNTDQTLTEFANEILSPCSKSYTKKYNNYIIDNNNAIKTPYLICGIITNQQRAYYLTVKNGIGYSIELESNDEYENIYPIVEKILSTFKFTN